MPGTCPKTGKHHLLVVAADREVELFRRVRPRDPALRRPRVRPAVDEIPEVEDPVVLAHLKLGKGPAKRCEVPVDVTYYQVSAPAVAL